MIQRTYPRIGESVYEETLENGLRVFVFPKPEFGKAYAFFATRYGGMDTRFQLNGKWLDTPMGIAHYLEHKMFDTPEGNALQILSANGASPNAFTGSDITAYHFECSDRFWENLRTLLTFVSVPYFTPESVEKERGIIGQEINMIQDRPGWQGFHLLLEALYAHHPVRNSVAGSLESIAEITPETLYHCHEAFYTPSNMVLCVAGNVDPERVCDMARELLPKERAALIPRDRGIHEPEEVCQKEVEKTMSVSAPLLHLGFKVPPAEDGPNRLRQRLLGELAAEALAGSSSPLYHRLYTAGLIKGDFFCTYVDYPGCAFLLAGGESRGPEEVRAALWQEAARIAQNGLDEGLFQRLKKASYGGYVRALNSFESLCVEQAQGYFAGQDPWTFPEIYESLSREDVEDCIGAWVREPRTAMTVIRPEEGPQ